jgi:hypothetical protein
MECGGSAAAFRCGGAALRAVPKRRQSRRTPSTRRLAAITGMPTGPHELDEVRKRLPFSPDLVLTRFDDNAVRSDRFPIESDENPIRVTRILIDFDEILIDSDARAIGVDEIFINSDGRAIGVNENFIACDQKLTLSDWKFHRARSESH